MARDFSLEGRIADLERKLAARRGKPAYKDNVPAIEAELAKLREMRDMIAGARA